MKPAPSFHLAMAHTSSSSSLKCSYGIVLVVCALLALGAGLLWSPDVDEDLREDLPEQTFGEGFTTSVTCQACHPAQYDAWHRSYPNSSRRSNDMDIYNSKRPCGSA